METTTQSLTDQADNLPGTETTAPDTTEPLEQLVGEGKKYKDINELAKAYLNADNHIKQLQKENATVIDKIADMEERQKEVLDYIKNQPVADNTTPPTTNVAGAESTNTGDDLEERVNKLVTQRLSEQQTKTQVEEAVNKSLQLVADLYGGKAEGLTVIRDLIAEKPSRKKLLDQLSQESPEELVDYLKSIKPPKQVQTNSVDVPNTGDIRDKEDSKKTGIPTTWSEFKELRRKDPKAYDKVRPHMIRLAEEYASKGRDFMTT